MVVETYEVEESTQEAALLSADHEAIELVEKMGLTGQQKLCNKDTVTRVPYRKMKEDEGIIYKQICPKVCGLEDYSEAIIPLRVLQVAEHAKSLQFFDSIIVWYAGNADVKDPVLIGVKKVPVRQWHEEELYILARWGEALESLEVLAEQAKVLFYNKTKAEYSKKLAKCKQILGELEEMKTCSITELSEQFKNIYV